MLTGVCVCVCVIVLLSYQADARAVNEIKAQPLPCIHPPVHSSVAVLTFDAV